MPRFFCDYCDAYLTHDSAPGRQQHCRGWKHRENFRNYYQKYYAEFAAQQQALQQQHAMMSGYGMPMMGPPGGVYAPPGMPPAPGMHPGMPPNIPPHLMFRPPPGAPAMSMPMPGSAPGTISGHPPPVPSQEPSS